MAIGLRLLGTAACVVAALPGVVSAQWLDYPTANVPLTADGKPNLTAPAPRTADGRARFHRNVGMGKPGKLWSALQRFSDFPGIYEHRRNPSWQQAALPARVCVWSRNGRRSRIPIPMFTACRATRHAFGPTTTTSGSSMVPGSGADPDRTQHAIPADLPGRASFAERPKSDLEWLLQRGSGMATRW